MGQDCCLGLLGCCSRQLALAFNFFLRCHRQMLLMQHERSCVDLEIYR